LQHEFQIARPRVDAGGAMKRALLAVPLAAALLAWGRGLVDAGFDYDEVMQAHSIWLVAQGFVPFRDFFECHPPFAWYAFVPVLALLPDAPEMLFGLRLVSLLGNAAWIAALFWAVRAARPTLRPEWLVVSAAIAASHAAVVAYAPQFRPDAWVWAAAFAALARAIRAPAGFRRAAELGAAAACARSRSRSSPSCFRAMPRSTSHGGATRPRYASSRGMRWASRSGSQSRSDSCSRSASLRATSSTCRSATTPTSRRTSARHTVSGGS
jgi:hypothetical protein